MKNYFSVYLLAAVVYSCSAAQDKQAAQGAAIYAGCQTALDIERDAGEAGAIEQTVSGCEAELKAWRMQGAGGAK